MRSFPLFALTPSRTLRLKCVLLMGIRRMFSMIVSMASSMSVFNSRLNAALRDKGVRWIGGGWLAFILENLVISHNRDAIIAEIGDQNYHAVYNTLSSLACGSILYGYIRHGRGKGPVMWNPSRPGFRVASFVLQSLGLIGFSQLFPKVQLPVTLQKNNQPDKETDLGVISNDALTASSSESVDKKQLFQVRCPMDFTPKDVPADGVFGLKRVTRHPTFWSLGFLGLGTALATPFAPEIVCFTAPALFAAIGGAHQDHRYMRGSGGTLPPEIYEKTSGIPFVAIIRGKQSFKDVCKELKATNAFLAVLIAISLSRRRIVLSRFTQQ